MIRFLKMLLAACFCRHSIEDDHAPDEVTPSTPPDREPVITGKGDGRVVAAYFSGHSSGEGGLSMAVIRGPLPLPTQMP